MSRATGGGDDLQDVRETELPFLVNREQVEIVVEPDREPQGAQGVSQRPLYFKLSPRPRAGCSSYVS